MNYTRITSEIIDKLQTIVSPDRIITDPEALDNYAHDETPLYHSMPELVVKPISTIEVSKIMHLANDLVIPVTPRGGGTSLSAGTVPAHGGIVLSLELMNRIKEIDTENLMAVVEPGIITETLGKELAKHGLFFPPDPVSLDSCMIGGNIAECAGGPRAMKYGVTKNYVLGIECVLPDGTIQRYGGKLLKNVTGYDLIGLITGSEGTLAIITEATIEVLSLPKFVIDLSIPFVCIEDAVAFSTDILQSGIMPTAIEFMDGDIYRLTGRILKRKLPNAEANAHLIVEIDGSEKNFLSQQYDQIGDIALKHGALDVFVAESEKDRERIWQPRKNAGEALKTYTKPLCREDLVVPKNQIPILISRLKSMITHYNAALFTFGHLGDGNIHADAGIIDGHIDPSSVNVKELRRKIYEITIHLGGMITAEHGVGLSKIDYLNMAL
ncbi:hypothetical protein A2Y85_03200, partial [candidate division WOR-3 bacterium RBG_13_43_14]